MSDGDTNDVLSLAEPDFRQPCGDPFGHGCSAEATSLMWAAHSWHGCPGQLYVCKHCEAKAIFYFAMIIPTGVRCTMCMEPLTESDLTEYLRFLEL